MPGRWSILAVLFAARATMGFQYQSVATVAPLVSRDFGVSLADIGFLIGLYLAPGVALALPGGAIGRRLGDKPAVIAGLALMVAGGAIMALVPTWQAQIAGRLLAGTGGVLLNVLMSKMVTDWFAGREIGTALGIFVNSWPVGIALALVVLPPVGNVAAAFGATAVLAAAGLVLVALLYRAPDSPDAHGVHSGALRGKALAAVIIAGAMWSLYNVAFAMVFGFGPTMLVEQGWSVTRAGFAVSIVLWLAILSVPIGGILADRTGRHGAILVASFIAFAALLVLASRTEAVLPTFVALGLIGGLPAGAIMSLPAIVLEPGTRAIGMGLFYTLHYTGMCAAPAVAGWLAARTGHAATAFDFGVAMLGICVGLWWLFRRVAPTASHERQAGS